MGSFGIRGAGAQRRAALRGGGGADDADRGFYTISRDKRHRFGGAHGLGGTAAVVLAPQKICGEKIRKSHGGGAFFVGQVLTRRGKGVKIKVKYGKIKD